MAIQNFEPDQTDREIVKLLMCDASLTSSEIGNKVGLSSSAANERVRRLKNDRIIKKIVALVDSTFMNMSLGAFIFVTVEGKKNNANFLKKTQAHGNILECHHVTGEYAYLLKVKCANTQALESLITDFLKEMKGVTRTTTQIILSSSKENSLAI